MAEVARLISTRRSQRFEPTRPITVAISKDGMSFAYGVVANLSEGGACLHTNVVPREHLLDVLLSFYDGEYVRTTGRIVWSESADGLATLGVQFTELTEQARHYLRSNFSGEAFSPM